MSSNSLRGEVVRLPWAELSGVEFIGIKPYKSSKAQGWGLFATRPISRAGSVLLKVPPQSILSRDNVWQCAKSDQQLFQLLKACGSLSSTDDGAITLFLLFQSMHLNTRNPIKIGLPNSFTHYVGSYPSYIPLPTCWTPGERAMLEGTTLKSATSAKITTINNEINQILISTKDLMWFTAFWSDSSVGSLRDKWFHVDALYRSRALYLPALGCVMVPCLDLVNHASEEAKIAQYDIDDDGNAVLRLREGKHLSTRDEITISYGDDKGACEMLFSYGFIEASMETAHVVFLDLDVPDDDPLKYAKRATCSDVPGVFLSNKDWIVEFKSPFVWLICVNEEDGLSLVRVPGESKPQILWKGSVIKDTGELERKLREEDKWDLFDLRANVILQNRIAEQLKCLENTEVMFGDESKKVDSSRVPSILKLRELEFSLLHEVHDVLETKIQWLAESDVCADYLSQYTDTSGSSAPSASS